MPRGRFGLKCRGVTDGDIGNAACEEVDLNKWRITMSRLQPMIDEYVAGPETLLKAVAGMSREQLTARPVAGKWSTLEVVCHLADFDPILADRMKQIIALDQPAMKGVDENRFASALGYHDRDLEEELA